MLPRIARGGFTSPTLQHLRPVQLLQITRLARGLSPRPAQTRQFELQRRLFSSGKRLDAVRQDGRVVVQKVEDPDAQVPAVDEQLEGLKRLFVTLAFMGFSVIALIAGKRFAANSTQGVGESLSHAPSDGESLILVPQSASQDRIESQLQEHPLVRSLYFDADHSRATRPHQKFPPPLRCHNLTAGALAGDGRLDVPPLVFVKPDGSSAIQFQHVGNLVNGSPGLVHEGLLTTLMDEGLASACFAALPRHVGVTASLKVSFVDRCPPNTWLVLHSWTERVDGRKAWVKGRLSKLIMPDPNQPLAARQTFDLETWTGQTVCEAEALFIQPKNTWAMPKIFG